MFSETAGRQINGLIPEVVVFKALELLSKLTSRLAQGEILKQPLFLQKISRNLLLTYVQWF